MEESIQENRGLFDIEPGDLGRRGIEQAKESRGDRVSILVQQGSDGNIELRIVQDGFGIFIFRLKETHPGQKVLKSLVFP